MLLIWSENNRLPSVKAVEKAWKMLVDEERSDLLKDFFSLSENQRKLMIYLANNDGGNIYSSRAAKQMDISSSSISSG